MQAAPRVGDLSDLPALTATGRNEAMEPIEALAAEFDDDESAEKRALTAWRAEQLEQLGLSRTLAEACAGLVDWHQMADLVKRGCTPHLALEIVR
jgi:hypothetical protein